jgi:glycosyltransferase involved in cell wall biosynthesis
VLPRLLYLGDVPVESSYHGSTLLFRLLESHPPERLRVIEGNLFPPISGRRLPGVTHTTLPVGRPRLLNSRLHDWYSRWLLRTAAARARQVPDLLARFDPEVVMTVGHAYSWVTAARFAANARLPLLIVVHDDWPRAVAPPLQGVVDRAFGEVYRQAAARLCTSPFMAEEYERRYGVGGTVLLPYRSAKTERFSGLAERVQHPQPPLVVAFAGTINSPGYAALLRMLAEALARHQGQLLIFGPVTEEQAAASGLALPNVRLGGLLTSDDLLARLRRDADVLFVPMSFADADRANMRMGFPTKLTDYTAVGVPLLICGPPDCSAVRWAHQDPSVAEVVTSTDEASLQGALDRLFRDPELRARLAQSAQDAGNRDFCHATAERTFRTALQAVQRAS